MAGEGRTFLELLSPTGSEQPIEQSPIDDGSTPLSSVANTLSNVPVAGNLLEGIGSGILSTLELGGRGVQAGAEAFGAEGVAESAGNFASIFSDAGNEFSAQQELLRLSDVEGIGSALDFGAQSIGQLLPLVGATIGGGALGAAVGGTAGAIGGATGTSLLLGTGEARGEQQELLDTGQIPGIDVGQAFVTGAQNAALDLAGLAFPAARLLGGGGSLTRAVGGGIAAEGVTETLQEGNLIRQRDLINNQDFNLSFEDQDRLLEAFVIGAIGGGALSAGGEIAARVRNANVQQQRTLELGVREDQIQQQRVVQQDLSPAATSLELAPEPVVPNEITLPVQPTVEAPVVPAPVVLGGQPTTVLPSAVTISETNTITDPISVDVATPQDVTNVVITEPQAVFQNEQTQSVTPPQTTQQAKQITQQEIDAVMNTNVGGVGKSKSRYPRNVIKRLTENEGSTSATELRNKLRWSKPQFERAVGLLTDLGLVTTDGDTLTYTQIDPALPPDVPGTTPNAPNIEQAVTPIPQPPAAPPVSGQSQPVETPIDTTGGLPPSPVPNAPPVPPQTLNAAPQQNQPATPPVAAPAVVSVPAFHETTNSARIVQSPVYESNTSLSLQDLTVRDAVVQLDDDNNSVYRIGELRTLDNKQVDPAGERFIEAVGSVAGKNVTVSRDVNTGTYTIRGATPEEFGYIYNMLQQAVNGDFRDSNNTISADQFRESLSVDDVTRAIQINEGVASPDEYIAQQFFVEPVTVQNQQMWMESVQEAVTKYPALRDMIRNTVGQESFTLYEQREEASLRQLDAIANNKLPTQRALKATVRKAVGISPSYNSLPISVVTKIPDDAITLDGVFYHSDITGDIYTTPELSARTNDLIFSMDLEVVKRWGAEQLIKDNQVEGFDGSITTIRNDVNVQPIFSQVSTEYAHLEALIGKPAATKMHELETLVRVRENNIQFAETLASSAMQSIEKAVASNRGYNADQVNQLLANSTYFMRVGARTLPRAGQTARQNIMNRQALLNNIADPSGKFANNAKGFKIANDLIQQLGTQFGIGGRIAIADKPFIKRNRLDTNNVDGFALQFGTDFVVGFSDAVIQTLASNPTTPEQRLQKQLAFETVAHEFGHVVVQDRFNILTEDSAARQEIKQSFNQWRQSRGQEPTDFDVVELYNQKLAPATSASRPQPAKNLVLTQAQRDYMLSFDEYFADQVSNFVLRQPQPSSTIEQFFSDLAQTLREVWQTITDGGYTDESIDRFLNGLLKRATETDLNARLATSIQPTINTTQAINQLAEAANDIGSGAKKSLKRFLQERAGFNAIKNTPSAISEFIDGAWSNNLGTMENNARRSAGFRRVLDTVFAQNHFAQRLQTRADRTMSGWNPINVKLISPVGKTTRDHKRNTRVAGEAAVIRQFIGSNIDKQNLERIAKGLLVRTNEVITKEVPMPNGVTQTLTVPKFEIDQTLADELVASAVMTRAQLQSIIEVETGFPDTNGKKGKRNVEQALGQLDDDSYNLFADALKAHVELYLDDARVDFARRMEISQTQVLTSVQMLGLSRQDFGSVRNLLLRVLGQLNEDTIAHRQINPNDPFIVSLPPAIANARQAVLSDLRDALDSGQVSILLADILNKAGVDPQQYNQAFNKTSQTRTPATQDQFNDFLNGMEQSLQLMSFRDDAILKAVNNSAEGFVSMRRFGSHVADVVFVDTNGNELTVKKAYRTILPFMRFENKSDAESAVTDFQNDLQGLELPVELVDGTTVNARMQAKYYTVSTRDRARREVSPTELFELNEQYGVTLSGEQRSILIRRMAGSDERIRRQQLRRNLRPGQTNDYNRMFATNLMELANGVAAKRYRGDVDRTLSNAVLWKEDPVRTALLERNLNDAIQVTGEKSPETLLSRKELEDHKRLHESPENIGLMQDEAKALVDFVRGNFNLNDTDSFLRFRSAVAIMQLGGSAASGIIQLTQIPLASLPYLAYRNHNKAFGGDYGMKAATKHLTLGIGQAGKILNPFKNGGDVFANIDDMVQQGNIPPDLGEFLKQETGSGVLQAAQFNALIGSSLGRDSRLNAQTQSAIFAWMLPFSKTEQINRLATGIANYNLAYNRATAAGRTDEDAQQIARVETIKTIRNTQGEYSLPNRQPWARSGIGSVLMMYKLYAATMVELVAHLDKRGKLFVIGTLLLASGVEGIPFAEDIEDIINDIMRLFGLGPRDAKLALNTTVDHLSEMYLGVDDASYYMRNGFLDSLSGLNISDRIGLGNLVPDITGPITNRGSVTETLDEFMGPAGGVFHGAERFVQTAQNYGLDDWRTLRSIPVTGARNLIDAYGVYRDDQVSDTRGYKVSDATTYTAIARAIGFTSSDSKEAFENTGTLRNITDMRRKMRAAYLTDIVYHTLRGNPDDTRAVYEEIAAWNKKVGDFTPGLLINLETKDVQRAIQDASLSLEDRTVKTLPLALRPFGQQLINR